MPVSGGSVLQTDPSLLGAKRAERRTGAAAEDVDAAAKRRAPAIYVVDEFLNVLYSREDPAERRVDCRMPTGGRTLPPVVERAVLALLRRTLGTPHADRVLTAAPDSSIIVRVLPLNGGSAGAFAVLVERLRLRRHLHVIAQRFGLSVRERQVLHFLVKGAKNSEIAAALNIAESTAIFHVKRLLSKTNSRNRTELVSKIVSA